MFFTLAMCFLLIEEVVCVSLFQNNPWFLFVPFFLGMAGISVVGKKLLVGEQKMGWLERSLSFRIDGVAMILFILLPYSEHILNRSLGNGILVLGSILALVLLFVGLFSRIRKIRKEKIPENVLVITPISNLLIIVDIAILMALTADEIINNGWTPLSKFRFGPLLFTIIIIVFEVKRPKGVSQEYLESA